MRISDWSSDVCSSDLSLGYLFSGASEVRRSQRLTASIPLDAPAAYAEGYRDWRVELRYRDPLGQPQQVSVPAPAPSFFEQSLSRKINSRPAREVSPSGQMSADRKSVG